MARKKVRKPMAKRMAIGKLKVGATRVNLGGVRSDRNISRPTGYDHSFLYGAHPN